MKITRQLLDEARKLLLAIAPLDCPLYVENWPEYLPRPSAHMNAFVADGKLWRMMREHLVTEGRWRGDGQIIVFVNEPLDRDDFFGLVLHEHGHVVLKPEPEHFQDITDEQKELDRDFAIKLAALGAMEPPVCLPWWFPHHGREFIRVVEHLAYRAAELGYNIPMPALSCAGAKYGLSGLWRYRRALGDEPKRMRDASFTEILNTPERAEFLEVWNYDNPKRKDRS